jgi:hypothetical protein
VIRRGKSFFHAESQTQSGLACRRPPDRATIPGMYLVTEADAAAIREVYERDGELSAAIELRRRFPGIEDNAKAREQARAIACWKPLPPRPAPIRRLRKGKVTP